MKRLERRIGWLALALSVAGSWVAVWAQQADTVRLTPAERQHRRHYLDSMRQFADLAPPTYPLSGERQTMQTEPLFPYPASYQIRHYGLPPHVYVLNNISLQIGGYVNLTNGQAWLWSPYPNGYLDARTLSLPLPR